jgi:AcrR family transcriptional regulator
VGRSGPSRRSGAAPPSRRAAIARAAIRLFGAGQFHGVNVPTISRAAGVAEGTIYTYFKSKEELARVVLAEASAEIERELLAGVPQQAGPLEQLELAAHVLLQVAEDDLERARFVLCVDHRAYLGVSSGLSGAVELLVANAFRAGLTKPLAAELLARVWLGVVAAVVRARAEGELTVGLTEVAESVASAAVDAIRA